MAKIPGYASNFARTAQEGRDAFAAGTERRLCPYVPGSWLYKAWLQGYDHDRPKNSLQISLESA